MTEAPTSAKHISRTPFPLTKLPEDLLVTVLEQLQELSPHSLRSCSATCHRFYRLAVPIIYRYRVLIRNSTWDRPTQRLIADGSSLAGFVRTVILDDRGSCGSNNAEPLIAFVRAARRSNNLESIEILGSYQVSQCLLDEIQILFPDVDIRFQAEYPREEDGWYQGWPDGPLAGGMNGFVSPLLRSLSIDSMWSVDDEGKQVVTRSLQNIIKGCPNLRALTTYRPGRGTSWRGELQELSLNFHGAESLPQLEEFSYVPISSDTVRTWGALTGWSNLQILRIDGPENLSAFGVELPTLRHLTLSTESNPGLAFDAIEAANCPISPLRSIHLSNLDCSRIPHKFLQHYANTVVEVSLHPMHTAKEGFTEHDIVTLNGTCPKLQRVCMYAHCDGVDWQYASIEKLACFDRLEELFLDCGHDYDKNLVPAPTPDACRKLYSIIQQGKASNPSGKPLQALGLHQGNDWVRRGRDWDDMKTRIRYLCSFSHTGEPNLTRPLSIWYDQNDHPLHARISRELRNPSLQNRPFSRAYHSHAMPHDLYWFAKQLGPGPKWAEEVLLPSGLLTQEQFDSVETPHTLDLVEISKRGGKDREMHREMVKEELQYWKSRRELQARFGKFSTLYDVLYSVDGGKGACLANRVEISCDGSKA